MSRLTPRAFAGVEEALRQDRLQCLLIGRMILALEGDGLIPLKGESLQRSKNQIRRTGLDSRGIQIVDTNQPFSSLRPGIEVTGDCSQQGSEMEGAAGRWRKTTPIGSRLGYRARQ